jgi:hypothetical protein
MGLAADVRATVKHLQPGKPPSLCDFDDSPYSDEECLRKAEEVFSSWLSILSRDPHCLTNLDTLNDAEKIWREFNALLALAPAREQDRMTAFPD